MLNTQINYHIEKYEKQFIKLKKKYKNKKIILYGASLYFQTIQKHYDLSELNIIAIADKKFSNPNADTDVGFKKISPLEIANLKPDIVLLTVYDDFDIEKYIQEELFKQTKKFKYKNFFEKSLKDKIQIAMENIIQLS